MKETSQRHHSSRDQEQSLQALLDTDVSRAEGGGSWFEKSIVSLAFFVSVFIIIVKLTMVERVVGFLGVVLLVDFLSGVVHWFFDQIAVPGPTYLGRVAIDFLDHHVYPNRTLEVGFFKSAFRPAIFVTLPGMFVVCFLTGILVPLLTWIFFFAMFIPQTHKLAHHSQVNPFIRFLQKKSIILNPNDHKIHHVFPHRQRYCVFTGWLNPLLDRVEFWDLLERWIKSLKKV